MGFIKNLFNNESTVVGLCDLKKRHSAQIIYETKACLINKLFAEPIENNILFQRVF